MTGFEKTVIPEGSSDVGVQAARWQRGEREKACRGLGNGAGRLDTEDGVAWSKDSVISSIKELDLSNLYAVGRPSVLHGWKEDHVSGVGLGIGESHRGGVCGIQGGPTSVIS